MILFDGLPVPSTLFLPVYSRVRCRERVCISTDVSRTCVYQYRRLKTVLYISLLMVTMSNDAELNPGPRIPKYPCGSCGRAVRNNQNSIQCDGCGSWHHIECKGMKTEIHEIMVNHKSYSLSCIKCGLPNFSTTFFDSSLSSFASSNTFSSLDASHSRTTSTPSKTVPNNISLKSV